MQAQYFFKGKVKKGKNRGKLLGFPTANIVLNKKIPEGIYASEVLINGKVYRSATFIGEAKTFGEKDYQGESYILDFNVNIYGKLIEVRLYKKIRDNKKFPSKEALIKQMKKDVEDVLAFFNKNP